MSASVPWSVNAVEPEAWATARDAARRAGMSVGEWLEAAIRESAGHASGEAPAPRKGGGPIEQRLDDLAERLDHFARHANSPIRQGARNETALLASIDTLNERIDALASDVRTGRDGPADMRAAIQRLEHRIEDLVARGRLAQAGVSPELEQRLDGIARTVETMSRRLEEENARLAGSLVPPTIPELDAAVAEIMLRQSALDGTPMRELPRRAAGPDLTHFERQLKIMADEMQAMRHAGARAESIEALRREVGELSSVLSELAPRRSLEALQEAVESLAGRVRRGDGRSDRTFSEIAHALQDIRTALDQVRPAESFASVGKDLLELSSKLDKLNLKGPSGAPGVDAGTIRRLQEQTSEIHDLVAKALPSDVLKALVDQVEILVGRLEDPPGPSEAAIVDVISTLDRRIESLSDRIETIAQKTPQAPALDDIRARLDELQQAVNGGSNGRERSAGLETALRGLSEKVEASQARLANLGTIEHSLNDLFAQLRDARTAANEAAERAARAAANEAADRAARTANDAAERATRTALRELADTLPKPPPAAPHTNGEPRAATPALQNHAPSTPPSGPIMAVRPELRAPTNGQRGAQVEPVPADFPLEPGSGPAHLRTTRNAAFRVAQSEAALGSLTSQPTSSAARASEFIAAARRAAQAAAAEPIAEARHQREIPVATVRASSGNGKRAILIAITAVMVIVAAMQFVDNRWLGLISIDFANPFGLIYEPSEPKTPAADNRSESSVSPEAARLAALPAHSIAADNPARVGTNPADPEPTGTITATAPEETAAVPKADSIAAAANELPTGIGTTALRAAAIGGDPVAAYEIGVRYLEGRGVPASIGEGVRWLELAIAKGSSPAAYRLANLHEKGIGVAKEAGEARRLYAIAAEAGHIKAMHNLAVMHAEGNDGAPDYKIAIRWFRMAAERGLRDSQYNLGVLYARGLGADQNLSESYRWFALAAAQGDAEAARKRDDVAKRLDVQSLVAAKLAVQTWSAQPVDPAANRPELKPEWEKADAAPRKKSVKK